MLTRLKALFGIKNPKYDWQAYLEDALFTKRFVTGLGNMPYVTYKTRVELPIYTKQAESFWGDMLSKGIFRLKGYHNKWVVVRISKTTVLLEEVVFIHQTKQRDS